MLPVDDMLRRLASGVRPVAGDSTRPDRAAAHDPFATLFAEARRGALRTDRPVHAPADFPEHVQPEMLAWLGAALDAAESHGAAVLAAIAGDTVYILDVNRRRIDRLGATDAGGLGTDIDALAVLPMNDAADDVETHRTTNDAQPDAQFAHDRHAQAVLDAARRWADRPMPMLLAGGDRSGTPRATPPPRGCARPGLNPSLAKLLASDSETPRRHDQP